VIDLAREHNRAPLLGNHELRLLNYRRTKDRKAKETDLDTFAKLRPRTGPILRAMPLTHELPELNTVFVHGGFLAR
jgi:serine/threonine protein phosphatase 1